jgi:hypothetical protein
MLNWLEAGHLILKLLVLSRLFGVSNGQAPQLRVIAIVPTAAENSAEPYGLDATQDLTVLFSRPVIALGSDFDNSSFTTGVHVVSDTSNREF